jgi:hypothetical protein
MRYRLTSAYVLHLQDLVYRGVRLEAGHLTEPGQLFRQRLQFRLLPLVQRTA